MFKSRDLGGTISWLEFNLIYQGNERHYLEITGTQSPLNKAGTIA